jgi:hypothetical protein
VQGLEVLDRALKTRKVVTLDEAVDLLRRAVDAANPDDPDRPQFMYNLAVALLTRFQRTGDATDLARAVEFFETAVAAIPAVHPHYPPMLFTLAEALCIRFDRTGNTADLDRAISVSEDAVTATPINNPDRPHYLAHLGATRLTRFMRTDSVADLDRAIDLLEQAVAATSADDPNWTTHLSNLGMALRTRFQRTGDTADLDQAITVEQAVAAIPPDHPESYRELTQEALDTVASQTRAVGERAAKLIGIELPKKRPAKKAPAKKATPAKKAAAKTRGAAAQLSSSVFAPPALEPGAVFLVQVFAHLPEHEAQVVTLAREFDEDAQRRGTVRFESPVFEGERLAFELLLPGLVVDDPVQSMVWIESPQSVQFGVSVPEDFPPGTVIGTVTVSRDSVPIGHLKFKVSVQPRVRVEDRKATEGHHMHRYSRAFISYASADRNEVLKRTQMLARVHIEFFQDLLSLEPGQRWRRELYREIDRCDVFLLFWSSAAKKSKWVLKEVRYAMARNGGDELAPPEILPVIIEGPPPVEAPPELAHLHFNDRMIYFMQPDP